MPQDLAPARQGEERGPPVSLRARIKADPRVASFWGEGEDGYWIELREGLEAGPGEGTIHEWTLRETWEKLRSVVATEAR